MSDKAKHNRREGLNIFRSIKLSVVLVAMTAIPLACERQDLESVAQQGVLGDSERGRVAVRQYACHVIPGIVGPNARVGPTLKGIGNRKYLAGVLPNTPENMIAWIRNPKQVDPLTAMPNMEVMEFDARDIAAYLYTLQ